MQLVSYRRVYKKNKGVLETVLFKGKREDQIVEREIEHNRNIIKQVYQRKRMK